ncbi:hypothetical protein QJS10_CPA10g01426 [Acorus calamus]|uniref:Senescence regulator n=1 Tax=Acorus calamus TaxID=4465 RepID=A0AAV9DYU6_ACOCL|nr:hypothetical protein QJS10_CPA10g01426 [Acorus calamus]
MGEEAPSSIPPTAHRNGSSPAVRFLGLLKQPDADHNPFEFDESDVIWPPSSSSSPSSPSPPSSASVSSSSGECRRHVLRQDGGVFGLSAALASDECHGSRSPIVSRRKTAAVDPSVSVSVRLPREAVTDFPFSVSGSSSGKMYHQSAPVNMPVWPKGMNGRFHRANGGGEEEEEEMLPPHEIVARSQRTTFSVFEGVGRTLKGRDLRRVRNAVFQKTGFID